MSRRVLAHETRGICHILGDVIIKFDYSDRILIGVMMECKIRCRIIVCNSYSMWYVRIPEIFMRMRVESSFMGGRSLQHAIIDILRWVYHNANDCRWSDLWDHWAPINISHMILHDIERVVANLLY